MKFTHIPLFLFLSEIILLSISPCSASVRVFTGTIQFPTALERIPSVRVYHAGRKLPVHLSEQGNSISFSITEGKSIFYLVVTPYIEFVTEENIVKHLTLCSKAPVKVYVLELLASDTPQSNKFSLTSLDTTALNPWHIKEVVPPVANARIPDDAIIVCLDPAWIARVDGGSAMSFPKIYIKSALVAEVGSEERIHELAAQWILAALNTDAIHGGVDQEVRASSLPKTVLAYNW